MNPVESMIKDCFERSIDIGVLGCEPSLWHMVQKYYIGTGLDAISARKRTDLVMEVFAKAVVDRLKITA